MVPINELRLGNFVFFDNEYLPVCSLQEDNTLRLLKDKKSIGCFSVELIFSVVLTKNIFLKAGFIMDESLAVCMKKQIKQNCWLQIYQYDSESYIVMLYQEGPKSAFNLLTVPENIKYLHQLQNLCFALTGEELKIQL